PARLSTVFKALADTRSRILRPNVSEISVTLRRFGRNRRLVFILEWLTLWPTSGFLPVSSQRRDIALSSKTRAPAGVGNRSNAGFKDEADVKKAGLRAQSGAINSDWNVFLC